MKYKKLPKADFDELEKIAAETYEQMINFLNFKLYGVNNYANYNKAEVDLIFFLIQSRINDHEETRKRIVKLHELMRYHNKEL